MEFEFRSPLKAVLLRRLAWESYVGHRQYTYDEIWEEHLPAARHELGLYPVEGDERANTAFLGKLFDAPKQLKMVGHNVRLVGDWLDEWRLQYVPPHDEVRRLSLNPAVRRFATIEDGDHRAGEMALRDTALPKLTVITGPLKSVANASQRFCGLYVIRRADGTYIGKSTDPSNRLGQHHSGGEPQWSVFVAPEASDQVDDEVFDVAEAVLISFWVEVARLENERRGKSQKPKSANRQQGVLLARGAAAALVWLLHHKIDLGLPALDIPFRKWPVQGWPECYLEPQEKPIVGDHGEWSRDAWDVIFGGEDEEEEDEFSDDPDLAGEDDAEQA